MIEKRDDINFCTGGIHVQSNQEVQVIADIPMSWTTHYD